jgi:hypothetical protein
MSSTFRLIELLGLLGGQARLILDQPGYGRHVDVRVDVDDRDAPARRLVKSVHGPTHRLRWAPRPVIDDSITFPSRR